MTKIYKCAKCDLMVDIVIDAACKPKCCGEPMVELVANTTDAATEKHVPFVTVEGNKVNVKVGEVDHPMLDAHYIQWIALETEKGVQRKYLKPGEAPHADFLVTDDDKPVAVYEYCNLHGLWKKDL